MDDPSALMSLWVPGGRAVAIGWALHRQGGDYLQSWLLPGNRGAARFLLDFGRDDRRWRPDYWICHLTRPRSARPFMVDDVQRLDRLRPWLAPRIPAARSGYSHQEDEAPIGTRRSNRTERSGRFDVRRETVYQTPGLEFLLRILAGEPGDYTRHVPVRDRLPAAILKLLRQITGAANGTFNTPPRTCGSPLTLQVRLAPNNRFSREVSSWHVEVSNGYYLLTLCLIVV